MPLLTGEEAESANQIALDIAADLWNWMNSSELCPLHSGAHGELAGQYAGIGLLFIELGRAQRDAKWRDRAAFCWERTVRRVSENTCGPDFFTGFTGAAWFGALLARGFQPDLFGRSSPWSDDDDPFLEIDQAVIAELMRREAPRADLMGGFAGLGLYLTSRTPHRSALDGLEVLVRRLDEMAIVDARGTCWSPPFSRLPRDFDRERFSEGCVPLGAAHGLAGILAVIARVIELGVSASIANQLFEDGVRYLLATRLQDDLHFTFGTSVHRDGSISAPATSWCWGDVGIIGMLHAAAIRSGHVELERCMRSAAETAAAISPERFPLRDASLCHGAAGRAHVLHRLYRWTGSERVAEASRQWFRATLAAKGREGFGGYRFFVRTDSVADMVLLASPGMLVGSAGVALALLSASSTEEPLWDMPFGLDAPVCSNGSPTLATR